MAKADIPLPRDVQSDLHDMADNVGEKVARGTLIGVVAEKAPLHRISECTCKRFSCKQDDGFIHFWYESDPNCKYIHLQPLPMPYKVKL